MGRRGMKVEISPEPALLGFLLAKPLHGYDLYRRVNEELGPIWHLGMSQMYAILSSYERQGWIGTRLENQKTHPARKMLEVTPAGRQTFHAWLRQTARGMRELRIDCFLRLYFARQAGSVEARKLIDRQREAVSRELALLTEESASTNKEENSFHRLAWDFRIHQLTTALKWLDGHRADLEHRSIVPTSPRAVVRQTHARTTEHPGTTEKNRRIA